MIVNENYAKAEMKDKIIFYLKLTKEIIKYIYKDFIDWINEE